MGCQQKKEGFALHIVKRKDTAAFDWRGQLAILNALVVEGGEEDPSATNG